MEIFRHTIGAHEDFELGIGRDRTVEYSVAIPDKGKPFGLVLYIAGFGEDAGSYRESFQQHICQDYQMACLTVDYHCIFSRPENGATVKIEMETLKLLRSLTGLVHHDNIDDIMSKAAELKSDPTTPLVIPGTLYPGKNEYQNFGLLPALDHIFAINDLFLKYPDIPKTIYAIGSSYGGYIANLISKLAPSTLNAVFDNSSWSSPNLTYISGHELNMPEFIGNLPPNIILELKVLSPWTHEPFMPNFFNQDRRLIRSFPENHLAVMGEAGQNKTIYRCVHAKKDIISNTEEKLTFVRNLRKSGFNIEIDIHSEEDIDGRYIKHLEHGMGLSMRLFFAKAFGQVKSRITNDQRLDFDFEHTLHYPCEDQTYSLSYKTNGQPQCTLSKRHAP